MPEYFCVSLIMKQTATSKETARRCLFENFRLVEGENNPGPFYNGNIVVTFIEEDKDVDFDEVCISFPEQIFHKGNFENELNTFTSFVNTCFECCPEVEFAVCSYEINGYLISETRKLKEFNKKLLSKFPISYRRQIGLKHPQLTLNLEAQDIF